MILKNSYGCTIIPNPKLVNPERIGQFSGSSLDRIVKPSPTEAKAANKAKNEVGEEIEQDKEPQPPKERSLSSRTKTKIKKKLFSFFGQYKKLTFLTLTFLNKVEDKIAVRLLGNFLENIKKADKDFEYLWVAERQTNNEVFKDNIHFHLITNKYWNIERYWKYWTDLQIKHGITPREESYKASSAFDVKSITSKNAKGISVYLTKYVTKNKSTFTCQPWNCSKKISMLYTDFYTGFGFKDQLERLEKHKEIEIKRVREEYCDLLYYPITKTTMRFYDGLHAKNKELWTTKTVEDARSE